VVIEIVYASVARTTMFCSLNYMRLTNIAFKIIVGAIENSPKDGSELKIAD